MKIHSFEVLPSTNQYCELLDLKQVEEFTIIWARSQTAGVGQQGNRWESKSGENLTFSLVLHPHKITVAGQYLLTKMLALGVSDCLQRLLLHHEVKIKWPNDIYVDDRKICGILTVNHVSGGYFDSAVCGIGLNVNQTLFGKDVPNPTSLALLTQQRHELEPLLRGVVESIQKRYESHREEIDRDYLDRLYRFKQWATYCYQGNTIQAMIDGVDCFGHLLLHTQQGVALSCAIKEIQFVMG